MYTHVYWEKATVRDLNGHILTGVVRDKTSLRVEYNGELPVLYVGGYHPLRIRSRLNKTHEHAGS